MTPAATALALIGALVAVGEAAAAPALRPGTVTGIVQSMTGGHSGTVAGQPVTLIAYLNNAEVERQTITTDAHGAFTFTAPADPARTYVLNATYKGGEYVSQPVTFKTGETAKSVTLPVYEPTTDAGTLRVNIHHLIVEPGEGVVRVTELIVFTNRTDRTYVGAATRPDGRRETLRFLLPQGAADLEYLEGVTEGSIVAVPGGFVDTRGVKPGMRQIGFSYSIPARGGRATFARALDYPTDAIEVFGAPTTRLTATPLTAQEPVATEQGTFTRFSAQSLPRGATVTLALSGLPAGWAGRWRVLVALFAGVAAAALLYPLLRRRRRPAEDMPRSREDLIKAIAALDDLYEAGGIAGAEYRRRRRRYKSRLLELLPKEEEEPE